MESHLVLGIRELWGQIQPFGLLTNDRRHHLYVIGQTGTGKTTLLRNLIIQDIQAGHGVGVIDPHGDLAQEILDHVPRRRTDDVAFFNPADVEYPVGVNLLGGIVHDQRHLVASGIVSVFKSIWPDSWGPRLEYILYATIAALLDCENVTLLGVQRMLTDARYRTWVVKQINDPVVHSFWVDEFERYDKRFLQEAIAPIQNKVGQLLMSPHMRNILGQVKSKIDARFMMDRGRIFIADISKGKLGADKSNLAGALLITQFQLAAVSRADMPESKRRDFHLYVDEFQNFASDSFISILSEARKYRLCLTLSHQYMDQLKPEIRKAVFGNVGSVLSFRVGQADAELLEQEFGHTYAARQFVELGNHEVYAKILAAGQHGEPIFGRTLPPSNTRAGKRETIIRQSRAKYSERRENVERKIRGWMKRR
jgi:hypothetical protein